MKNFLLFLVFMGSLVAFSQVEELAPLNSNLELVKGNQKLKNLEKTLVTSFDSTFIFIPDTLQIPFLDEFSTNKFQTYRYEFNGVNTTFVKEYKLLDKNTLAPLDIKVKYSKIQTNRRSFNKSTHTEVVTPLDGIEIKLGDQSEYPTVYSTTTVYPPYNILDTVDFPNPSDTIWIQPDVVQDSAYQFMTKISDPTKYWLDSRAYHNFRYPVDPYTLGVATFDGLDANGMAYSIGATHPSIADVLTSKPINISSYTDADSLYFSFLYQPAGYGDEPEGEDSLILEFFAPELDEWIHVWSVSGSPLSVFKKVHIPIRDPKFFKKAFQFRFSNYGSLAGSFDHFNLDFVHLRKGSNKQDTMFKDFAFTYPIKSLLKDYTSVPWDHYKNNYTGKMSSKVELKVRNGSNQPENNSGLAKVEILYNGAQEHVFDVPGVKLANNELNYSPFTFYTSLHDFSTDPAKRFNENKAGNKQIFDLKGTVNVNFANNLTINDTTHTNQVFSNYYSYDDGTSEAAYGPSGSQVRLAVRFDAYEEDSIIGIMAQFVKSGTDVSSKLFLLTVWDDNNGVPGAVLYEDETFSPRVPKYENLVNGFYTYYFKDKLKVKVKKTFYVGWRQLDPQRLNIGFDRNTDASSKNFYSTTNGVSWSGSQIPGAVMMRPVFSTALDAELNLVENTLMQPELKIYPNPTTGKIHLESERPIEGVEVFNLQGIKILESNESELDLQNFESGVYFLREKGGKSKLYKIVKN